MTDGTTPEGAGWFADLAPDDLDGASAAIDAGSAAQPHDWPRLAVEAGYVDTVEEYYERLHAATIHAARTEARRRSLAGDQQLIHAIRAVDDCARTANELSERLAEWAGGRFDLDASGLELARQLAFREPAGSAEARIVSLADRVVDLADERDALREYVEREAPRVAPNLAAIAGPVLAARLIALAGGLEPLAKKPSGTVQVLGAEDALFAHLRGRAPSPKHGVIFTHEYVRGTAADRRGSAARALAGKLAIAARVDHYSGERKPEIEAELEARMLRIRERGS